MVDVLLINPRHNGRSEIPPLGLECLASMLLHDGLDVAICDLDAGIPLEKCDEFLSREIRLHNPGIIGVSSMSGSYASAARVCEIAKEMDPGLLTVMGGIHASVLAEPVLRDNPSVDAVVRGEGEISFSELVRRFLKKESFWEIRGISFRRKGRIIHNPDQVLISNLDDLPAPAHGLVDNRLYRTRSISSARGCFHRCTFCSIQSQYHGKVRTRDVGRVVEEIGALISCGAKRIMFTDDNFTYDMKRVRDICAQIKRRSINGRVEFFAEGRIDDICRNPLIAGILSDAGFRGIYIGAESGSQEILDYYRKDIDTDDLARGVAYCVEQNLTPVVNFILFGPRDSIRTIRETISQARNLYENGAEITFAEMLIPYPGTPIHEELKINGKFVETQGAFHFQPYGELDIERLLRICDLSRGIADLLHAGDYLFQEKKTYLRLGYIDEMISGQVPREFDEAYKSHATTGRVPQEIENIHKELNLLAIN
ncbi:MAG: radical SAM protein [Syntrophales bacterium]